MNERQRGFLDELLTTPSPSGFEAAGQRVWVDYVSEFADDVRTDEYGNAVAVHDSDGPEIAFAGHADEIGLIVTGVDEDGFVRIDRIGGSDHTVTKGQHVEIHTDDGIVPGVVGQAPVHLRDPEDDELEAIAEQHVDVGAASEEEANDLVDVGDPITITQTLRDLHGTCVAARGLDNRVGTWTAAEALRRAAETDVDATVYAVSTVQEEVGLKGAQMVGFDLTPDAAIAIDVTQALDSPDVDEEEYKAIDIDLGGGPVVARGSANHPIVVEAVREAAAAAEIPVQLEATGIRTGTDADAFYTASGGIPSLNLGLPNRYMHTPVEMIDTDDLDAAADLLAAFADRAGERDDFAVDV